MQTKGRPSAQRGIDCSLSRGCISSLGSAATSDKAGQAQNGSKRTQSSSRRGGKFPPIGQVWPIRIGSDGSASERWC